MTVDFGTQFYAPSMRLVDVETNQVIGAEIASSDGAQPLLGIVSARVTLVNTGVSQLQVVLVNQIYTPSGMPAVPPWLFNGLDRLRFAQVVRLDMRYGDQPWTKMIVAQINDMQFTFPTGGGAQVTIVGEDYVCRLKRKPREDKRYDPGQTEDQIARDVVSRAGGLPAYMQAALETRQRSDDGYLETRGPLVELPAFTEELPSVTHQKTQTYLQFLQSIAERLDYEIFVDFAKNYLPLDAPGAALPASESGPRDPSPNEQIFHFEPARSLINGGGPRFVVDLAWGMNLVEFNPKLKVWDLPTEVEVRGRAPTSVTRVEHMIADDDAVDAVIRADLGRLAGEPPITPSTELRRHYFQAIPNPENKLEIDVTNLREQRAIRKAEAALRDKHRAMVGVEAKTIGFPSIRAGIHVDVSLLYAPFDGLYYVTKAVHSFDANGYTTELSLRRPGLQPPDEYAWSIRSGRRPGIIPPQEPAQEGSP